MDGLQAANANPKKLIRIHFPFAFGLHNRLVLDLLSKARDRLSEAVKKEGPRRGGSDIEAYNEGLGTGCARSGRRNHLSL
jgi:hypothetical protein